MKRDEIDFSYIAPRHEQVHIRLEEWSNWVRVWYQPWQQQRMFRGYRSHSWQLERPIPKAQINTIRAHETEKAVSFLPEKNRTVVRWAYVYSHVPVNAVRREVAATREGVAELLAGGLDMLNNRLRETLVDRGA